ncbi:MAG: hypothetical protein Q9183_004800 [Haloplaca sp. 2 TL-2023]
MPRPRPSMPADYSIGGGGRSTDGGAGRMGGRRPGPRRRRDSFEGRTSPIEDETPWSEDEDDDDDDLSLGIFSDSDSNTDGFSFLGASGPAHPPGERGGRRMGGSMGGAYGRSRSYERNRPSDNLGTHGQGPFHTIFFEVLQSSHCPFNNGDGDHSASAGCEGNIIDKVLEWVDHFGFNGPAEPRAIRSFLRPHIQAIRMNYVELAREMGFDARDFEDVKRLMEERALEDEELRRGGGGGRYGGHGGHGGGGRHGRHGGGGSRRYGGHGMGYGY